MASRELHATLATQPTPTTTMVFQVQHATLARPPITTTAMASRVQHAISALPVITTGRAEVSPRAASLQKARVPLHYLTLYLKGQ